MRDVALDEDNVVQISLLANEINCVISGINCAAESANLTSEEIDRLQTLCLNFGRALIQTFGIGANTEVHKLMHHLKDQICDFGNVIWSTNDLKETIHKDTKLAFTNTNKSPDLLVPQLLSKRRSTVLPSFMQSEEEEAVYIATCVSSCPCRISNIGTSLQQSVQILQASQSIEQRLYLLFQLKFPVGSQVWSMKRLTTLCVKYP